jgi:hypothetical protein
MNDVRNTKKYIKPAYTTEVPREGFRLCGKMMWRMTQHRWDLSIGEK